MLIQIDYPQETWDKIQQIADVNCVSIEEVFKRKLPNPFNWFTKAEQTKKQRRKINHRKHTPKVCV